MPALLSENASPEREILSPESCQLLYSNEWQSRQDAKQLVLAVCARSEVMIGRISTTYREDEVPTLVEIERFMLSRSPRNILNV